MKHNTRNIDIDAMFRQMAREDGYDARRMSHDPLHDTAPAECEPDEVQCEYEREPVMSKGDLQAVVFVIAMAALGLVVLGVMWWIRASNSTVTP